MNPTIIWVGYAALLLIGVFFYLGAAGEKVYTRISLPQLFYVMYLMGFAAFSATAFRNLPLAILFLSMPLGFLAWLTLQGEPDLDCDLRNEFQRDLDAILRAVKEKPEDVIVLDNLGEVYRKIGDGAMAKKHFTKLLEIYSRRSDLIGLKSSLEQKLRYLDIKGGTCADNPRFPLILRSCPRCESIALRMWFSCPRCDYEFFPDRWSWRAVRGNQYLDDTNLAKISMFGLLFLPFLFMGGALVYGLLLGVWTLAFATTRTTEVKGEWDLSEEKFTFLKRMGAILTLLLVFMGTSVKPSSDAAAPAARAPDKGKSAPPDFAKVLAEARGKGRLNKAYSNGTTLEQILDEVGQGRRSASITNALAEAQARGDLDKPLSDGVTFNQILEEAKQGRAGEAVNKVLAGAEARGDLDAIKVQGKSLAQYQREATALSNKADELGRKLEEEMFKEQGIDPAAVDVHADVKKMIELLGVPRDRDQDARLYGAQQLSDLRLAANAHDAIPALEKALQDEDPQVRDAAQMALGRIRMCEHNTLCQQKWKKR